MNHTKNRTALRKNQGFTLIEIAVVLVIIGALLGGVLQGAKLIDNAKVRKAIGELESIGVAYRAYQDKYNRKPGDDGGLTSLRERGGDWAFINRAGDRDGILDVSISNIFSDSPESELAGFWQHLRASGLILGDPSLSGSTSYPVNAFGGRISVTSNSDSGFFGYMSGDKVCMNQVPGSAALAMDNKMDDGDPATGRLRASEGGAGSSASAYNETTSYSMCLRMT